MKGTGDLLVCMLLRHRVQSRSKGRGRQEIEHVRYVCMYIVYVLGVHVSAVKPANGVCRTGAG